MAAVILAIGAAVLFTSDKIKQRKEAKREAQALAHGNVEELWDAESDDEALPKYQQRLGNPPAYQESNATHQKKEKKARKGGRVLDKLSRGQKTKARQSATN